MTAERAAKAATIASRSSAPLALPLLQVDAYSCDAQPCRAIDRRLCEGQSVATPDARDARQGNRPCPIRSSSPVASMRDRTAQGELIVASCPNEHRWHLQRLLLVKSHDDHSQWSP